MAGSEDASLRVVGEDSAAAEAAGELVVDLRRQVLGSEDQVISLEHQLAKTIELETDAARQLDLRRRHRVAVDQQLHDAREEAARLMVEEASQKRDATVAGAVAEAELEVNRITMETFDQAKEMLAEARRESAAITEAGREELIALEAASARRAADLSAEREELMRRRGVMERLRNELQETLKLVAETSIEELAVTQVSMKQLDPVDTDAPQSDRS
jgi:D-arabinose 1-dehydrogenase-like Zn-dependent alcohol dehydrogenase